MDTTVEVHPEILIEVRKGLSTHPKSLPSWLLYDDAGDKIFQEIMKLPEYYLTDSEFEVIKKYKNSFLKHFSPDGEPFELIELGAGDGTKTEILLSHFLSQNADLVYAPVDVSKNVLDTLSARMLKKLPELVIEPQAKRYYQALHDLKQRNERKNVVLFMGANIGNFHFEEAIDFMRNLANSLNDGDQMLVGFDLKKDPRIIQAAYDDNQGVTKQFNLNMLERLNRELQADFNLEHFDHAPYYNPQSGEAKSYLVSTKKQLVHIQSLNLKIPFDAWETIYTEISQKYDMEMIKSMARHSGLIIETTYYDNQYYFCNVLFKKQ